MFRSFFPLVGACLVISQVAFFGAAMADEEPAELVQARGAYQKEIEFSTRPIRDRYLTKLDGLKRSFGSRGDARGAIAVQFEIDRVKGATGPAGIPQLAGTWGVYYSNGSSRRYVLNADGTAAFVDDNRLPINRTGKVIHRSGDYLLDFNDGVSIERISLQGDLLLLEHWNPKGTFPSGKPVAQGVGIRQNTGK